MRAQPTVVPAASPAMNATGQRIRGRIQQLTRGRRRNVLLVMGGTFGGQLVGLICAPVLSRMYAPSAFGAFAVITALVIMVGSAAALRLDAAVPLPVSDDDARATAFAGIGCALATTSLCFLVLWVWGASLAEVLAYPGDPRGLLVVPPIAFGMACTMVLTQWMIRHKRYGRVGSRSFLQPAVTAGAQTALGGFGFLTNGLVLGFLAGQTISTASLCAGSGLFRRRASGRPWSMVKRYWRFPVYSTPATVINTAAAQMSVVFIAAWYGATDAGFYGLAQRVVALPVVLIGAAASQVYLGEMAHDVRQRGGADATMFWRTTRWLLVPAGLLVVVMLVAGPLLFGWVFGAAWTGSGEFARAMSVATGAQMVAAPLGSTLVVLEKQHVQAIWDLGRLLVMGLAVFLVAATGGPAVAAVWALSGVSAVAYIVLWWSCRQALNKARPRVDHSR